MGGGAMVILENNSLPSNIKKKLEAQGPGAPLIAFN